MTRPQYPVTGVSFDPEDLRYGGPGTPANALRYVQHHETNGHRGQCGVYISLPTTIEEEVGNGGWLPGSVPTGPRPRRLFTLGMRGEPGFDDDPSPDTTNSYRETGAGIDVNEATPSMMERTDGGSSWD